MSGYYLLNNGEFAYNKSYSKGYDFGSIKGWICMIVVRYQRYISALHLMERKILIFIKSILIVYYGIQNCRKYVQEGARNHGLLNVPTNDFFQLKLCVP